MPIDPLRTRAVVDAAFEALCARLADDPALQAELEQSEAEFPSAAPDPVDAANQQRRRLEWFLLERPSEFLGGVPIECWAGDLAAQHDGVEALLASSAAVYEVLVCGADCALRVRDMLARTEHVLDEPEVALELLPGDLVVGRIFPTPHGAAVLSPAAIWVRDSTLLTALQRDLDALRTGRRGTLRISQADLERMFFAPKSAEDAPRRLPSRALRAIQTQLGLFLRQAGFDTEEVADWLAELHETPLAERGMIPGGDDVLGRLLEELAIRSDVDLEHARALVLSAWQATDQLSAAELAGSEPAAAEPANPAAAEAEPDTDAGGAQERWRAADALAAFDSERAAGADLEAAFQKLERRLGISDDEDDESSAEEYEAPGVLEVLLTEYAWDRQRSGRPLEPAEQRWLTLFASANAALPGLEDLDARLLVRFAGGHAIQTGHLHSAEEAVQLCDALRAFADWCEREQDHPLRASALLALDALQPELERAARVNHELAAGEFAAGAGAPAAAPAAVVRAIHAPDCLELAEGRKTRSVRLLRSVPEHLRVGDWVQCSPERAAEGEARQLLLRVYPAQAASALEA